MVSDFIFRYQEQGIRALGLVAVAGVAVWAAFEHLVPLLAWRLTHVDVARVVDARVPALAHRAASALEFAELAAARGTPGSFRGDAAAASGSRRLREAVVAEASSAISGARLETVLDYRPTLRAVATALAVLSAGAALFAGSPENARLALARFVDPTSDVPWPPRHRLAFDPAVDRVAQGDAFEIRVVERDGNLPDEVWMEYADARDADGSEPPSLDAAEARVAMQRVGDAMIARRENVRTSFWYRATGGDDTAMPWRKLEVVESPRLATCQIVVHAPEYTAWPPMASPRAIRALVGSRVGIDAEANRPLASAAVVLESGVRIPLAVDSSGRRVSLAADGVGGWTVDDSRSYQFELVARDGTRSRSSDERWELQPIVDLPPVVAIESPPAVVYATPQARIRLRVAASDDLALSRVSLVRRLVRGASPVVAEGEANADRAEQAFEIFRATKPAAEPRDGEHPLARWPRDHRIGPVNAEWRLASLAPQAGDTIEYEAVAVDRGGRETRSPTQRILVVSPQEFLDRAIDQQAHIAEQLLRAIELARQSQRSLAALRVKVQQSGTLSDADADALRAVETEHRQVVRILVEPATGVAPLCEALLADLDANGVALPDSNRRVEQIRSEIRRLEREEFGPFDRAFADVWTALRASRPSAASLAAALAGAIARHDRIVDTLAALHEALAHWDNVRRVSREAAEIRRIEQGLLSRSIELARTTLGVRIDDLPADTRAELVQLVESQRDLRRRLDRIQSRMDKLLASVSTDDPHAAGILTDALDFLATNPIAGQLSTAADQIAANRLGQAAETQTTAVRLLGELLALLDNRPETDPERLAERLAAASKRLEELRREFGLVAPGVREAAGIDERAQRAAAAARLDPVAKALSRDLARLARETVRLDALQAGERIARSAAALDGVAGAIVERAADMPATTKAIDADLAAAANLLATAARRLESERIREHLATIAEAAADILRREEMLLAESKGFEQFATSATADAWKNATADAIERQEALAVETGALAATAKVEAFGVALRTAADEMHEAAGLLGAARTLARAADLQRLAIGRLRQLVAATAPVEAPPNAPPPQPHDPNAEPAAPPLGAVHVVEELRLVRAMQAALNDRTAAFHALAGNAVPTEETRRQVAALASEQQRLAELFRKLFVDVNNAAASDAPSDDQQRPTIPSDDAPSPIGP